MHIRGIDKYSPRTIDLDLVLYGNLVINKNTLILPEQK
jgi:7,8-dihydro-6-hydroxymethylpterin-pyrophosphokinase